MIHFSIFHSDFAPPSLRWCEHSFVFTPLPFSTTECRSCSTHSFILPIGVQQSFAMKNNVYSEWLITKMQYLLSLSKASAAVESNHSRCIKLTRSNHIYRFKCHFMTKGFAPHRRKLAELEVRNAFCHQIGHFPPFKQINTVYQVVRPCAWLFWWGHSKSPPYFVIWRTVKKVTL